MEGLPEDLWSPYKYVQKQVQRILINKSDTSIAELEGCLKKCKQTFASLLKNPPKNEEHRNQLINGMSEGFLVCGTNRNLILSKDLVDESLIISDMFDLDEIIALELLCTAQRQMLQHPGLPRGLVAMLLYYDGRKAISQVLRDLFQATSGATWVTDAPKEIVSTISLYTQTLVADYDILSKIIDLLDDLDFAKENLILTKNRALGTKKHQNQVKELYEDIRINLATALFNWSAQRGLPKNVVIKLLQKLNKYTSSEPTGCVDDVTLILLMALFYSYDVCVLHRQENDTVSVQRLPIFSDQKFLEQVFGIIQNSSCENSVLMCLIKFSFGITLTNLRHIPHILDGNLQIIDRDEELVDQAIVNQVFYFIHNFILDKDIIYRNEFFYRQFHNLFTNFIDLMNSKITELRGKADESAKAIMSFSNEGLDPPSNIDRSFEYFLLCIGKLYKDNKASLSLCTEYWGPYDMSSTSMKTNARSISLFKFIRLSGELLPSTLFVPYLKMISGLTSCEQSARGAFNFLKQTSGLSGSSTLSWEHFFSSLARYYANLRDEQYAGSDTIYRSRTSSRLISPQEIDGLINVLEVVKAVANYDEISRLAIGENLSWNVFNILIGLLSCCVPLALKAQIMTTLAALAKSKDTASIIWTKIEASQIISTIPTIQSFVSSNIIEDINQNEVRMESYPLTKGVLDLLYTLVTTSIPKNLGGGQRKPGLDPYVEFLLGGIFLKFYNRNYKNPAEKWEISEKCLKIFDFFLKSYECATKDFDLNQEHNPPPGYHIMIQLHTKSEFLRLLLLIIDDTRAILDDFNVFPGKQKLQDCAFYTLSIIQNALFKQDLFFEAHSAAGGSLMVFGLNKILLDINPRSGRPDHIINILRFVTYWTWLPYQTLFAIKILVIVCRSHTLSNQVLGLCTSNDAAQLEIRQGFVENLESEISPSSMTEEDFGQDSSQYSVELQIKESIIQLLQESLLQPGLSITHFLLGIESNITQKGFLNVSDGNTNCTKALIYLLDNYAAATKDSEIFNADCEKVIERAYNLLYSLCSSPRTSENILRYLRTCTDFLSRHVYAVSCKNLEESLIVFQISHILKCVAIELKYTARNCQISRFQQMSEFLTGISGKNNNDNIPVELINYRSHHSLLTGNTSRIKDAENKINLLCQLLYRIEIESTPIKIPKWEFFDNSLTKQALSDCEIKSVHGHKVINIKHLHDLLYSELGYIQNTIASGQHKFIVSEIQSVLRYAIEVNSERNKQFAIVKALEAWGQVTEILFSCAPELAMPIAIKKELILDILQNLLSKIVPSQPNFDISIIASGTVLLLLVNLRNCFIKALDLKEISTDGSSNIPNLSLEGNLPESSSKSNNLSLKYILKNLLEWILISGVSSQKLRINLYAGLLSCLKILNTNNSNTSSVPENNTTLTFHLDKSVGKKALNAQEAEDNGLALEVFLSFGEKLIDIICNDAVAGHDICKMLAFSCLDTILDMELVPGTIDFIVNRGYFIQIVESLKNTDENLCRMLCHISENLRSFYLYESKMAMFLRIANSQFGAEVILSNNVLFTLSSMNVFDMHPDLQVSYAQTQYDKSSFLPAIESRFRQILFPALNLCDALLSTLGPENHSAVSQIMHFLFAHSEMIEVVLRNASPKMELSFLEEVSGLTNLIARTFNQELYLNAINPTSGEIYGNLLKIQRMMLTLLDRFIINESSLKEIVKAENTSYELTEANKNLHIKYILEIAANIALFCRNSIANHTADHKLNRAIFTPSLSDIMQRNDNKQHNLLKNNQSLSIILSQLKGSVDYFNSQKSALEQILQQRTAITNISFDQNTRVSFIDLTDRYVKKKSELSLCVFITEQCLYLLWSHLDYFMRLYLAKRNDESLIDSERNLYQDNFCDVTNEDMVNLRKCLVSLFNETFCKQLLETSEYSGTENYGFNEVLLRRIKHLTQFV